MDADKILIEQIEEDYDKADLVEEEKEISLQETVEIIKVESVESFAIEVSEAFASLGSPNDMSVHGNLTGLNDPNQHSISAITGLRAELNSLNTKKTPQTLYSDKVNIANYYKWNDNAYNEYGYFVSLVPHTATVKICDGTDIFGVTVDAAGFVGNQGANAPRDNDYALVATSGLVDVKCESTVAEGDYVVSNAYGIATKTTSGYGYKVIAIENKHGTDYASISLDVQACTTDLMAQQIHDLGNRIDDAEVNISAAINVANEAYNKAQDSMTAGQIIGDQVSDALDRVDDIEADVENMGAQVGNIATITAQAKAIAESAATSAESMKNDAVEKANEALAETSELRKEFEAKVTDINTELDNTELELQATKEIIEATRDELQTNIDGVSSDLETTKADLNSTKNELSSEINDITKEVNATKVEINTTKSNVEALEDEIQPLVTWTDGTNTGTAGFVAKSNENSATLANIVIWQGETNKSIAGFKQEVADTYATIESVSSLKTETTEAISGVTQIANENKASIDAMTLWQNETDESLAKISEKADANESNISSLTSWKNSASESITKIEQKSNANESNIKLLTAWKSDVEDDVESIASIKTQSDANKSSIESLTSWQGTTNESLASVKQQSDANKASIDSIASWQGKTDESIAQVKQQADGNTASIKSLTEWKGTTSESISSIEQRVDDTESSISSLTSWQGDAKTSIANVEQKASSNESKINSLTSWKDDASDAIASVEQKANSNEASIKDLTSWQGDATKSIAAVEQKTNANESSINSLTTWQGEAKKSISAVEQKASNNESSINSLTKWQGETNNAISSIEQKTNSHESSINSLTSWQGGVNTSIAGVEQKASSNESKINSLTSWQGDTNIAMARIEQKADANGAYIQSTVSNMDKYGVGPYSQAQGFTLDQAKTVLENGMIYVPTVSHSGETYNKNYSFTKTNMYEWSGTTWVESVGKVVFSSTKPSGTTYPLWYINSATAPSGYEPYTLYKLESYKNEAGTTLSQWVAVATLVGNSTSRSVSQIRQDANNIELSVTALDNKYAGTKVWVDDNKAAIQDTVMWKNNNATSIATFMSTAEDNFASASQVAKIVDKNGNINAASIVTAVNDAGSSVVIDADHINLNGYVTVSDLSGNGTTTINGSNITTGLISADVIDASSLKVSAANITGSLTVGQLPSTVAEKSDVPTKVSELTNDSGYQNQTGVVSIVDGRITADYVEALGITVDSAKITGKLTIGQLPDTVAETGDIPTKVSELSNDSGYQNQTGVVSIVDGRITADYIEALNIHIQAAQIDDTLTIGHLPDTVAEKSDIPTTTSQLINNSGFQDATGVTTIVDGRITTDYIEALNISVDMAHVTGLLNVDGKISASNIDVSGVITAGSAEIEEIVADKIEATEIYVDMAHVTGLLNVDGKITADKIDADGITANNATIGGTLTAGNGSIIGPFYVSEYSLTAMGETELSDTSMSKDGITCPSLTASSATISGGSLSDMDSIGAKSATIGGGTLSNMDSISTAGVSIGAKSITVQTGFPSIEMTAGNSIASLVGTGGVSVDFIGYQSDFKTEVGRLSGTWINNSSQAISSDANKKNTIHDICNDYRYDVMYDSLRPVTYKYNDGTSGRVHTGYIAQDVLCAIETSGLTTADFAGYIKVKEIDQKTGEETESCYLRYEEFVALNTDQIQKLKARVAELENKIALLERE